MKNNKIAVMDLGTNTFHLLIAEVNKGQIYFLLRDFEPVKLGEGGINKGMIQPAAFARGLQAMKSFAEKLEEFQPAKVKAIATSMLRNSANGRQFMDEVKASTGISIELIDGQLEATYIFNGVKASGCLPAAHSLIMDIGGGSVEFILCDGAQIIWKHSFEIGAARLMDRFHKADPITHDAIVAMELYLDQVLEPLFAACGNQPVEKLIGSAGAFETFAEVIELGKGIAFNLLEIKSYDFKLRDFINATNTIIRSNHQERADMPGIIPLRVDMIVVASLLTRFVMEKLHIQKLGMSTYSLKEGVLLGME